MDDPVDLLTARVLTAVRSDGCEALSLPGIFAALGDGAPIQFMALRPHQAHPWHAFLVQLGAIALHRAGQTSVAIDEAEWRRLLVEAARVDGSGPEAFSLVVTDAKKAAFLQPPSPSGSITDLKALHDTPSEELDVLITAKNLDVKIDALAAPSHEQWIFALVALQTMQGFLGAGNYGIARMNGGFASRPCVAVTPSLDSGVRFRRDIEVLLQERPRLLDRGMSPSGPALIWCLPWDGTRSLALPDLDPYFIEVCRRVRLFRNPDGRIAARRGSSKVARIDGKAALGNTGDIWTPVKIETGAALTVSESGFTYKLVQQLLLDDGWSLGAAGRLRQTDGDHPLFVLSVLVRGQGKTGGFHQRTIPVPKAARNIFVERSERDRMAKRATGWIERVDVARNRVLRPAVLTLLQAGPEKLDFDDERAAPFVAAFEREVDRDFFPMLFQYAGTSPEDADAFWEDWLADRLRRTFDDAIDSVPLPTARRARAIAKAEQVLYGALRNQFKARERLVSVNKDQEAAGGVG